MKQSLISHVETIEQEATQIIEDAKRAAEQELASVGKSMKDAQTAIAAKAANTSAEIIAEYTKQAEHEAHQISKESVDTVSIIHAAAEKNRARGVAKAAQLFAEEYGVSLS